MSALDSNKPAPVPQPVRAPAEIGTSLYLNPASAQAGFVAGALESTSPPPALSEASGAALFQAVRRRWPLGLSLGILGAACAAAVTWLVLPPKYQAQALLHVASRTPKGVFSSEGAYETNEEFAAYKGTQTTILKSLPVLSTVLRQQQFADLRETLSQEDALQWLERNLQVDTLLGPEILRATFSSEQPEQAATILNAVTEAYLSEVARREQDKRQARMEQLEASVRKYEEITRKKRNTLHELSDSLGIDDPQTLTLRFQSSLAQEAAAKQKLMDARMDLNKTRLDLAASKELLDKPAAIAISEAVIMEYLRQDPRAQRQLALLSLVEEEIQKYRETVAAPFQGSLLAAPEKRRTQIMEALEVRRREIRPFLEADLRAKFEAESKQKIRQFESHLQAAGEHVKALEAEVRQQEELVKRWSIAINRPDKPTSDLEALRSDLITTEATQKKVTEQLEMLRVEPRIPSRVSVLVPAQVPRDKNYWPLIKLGGLSALAVFSLTFLSVALPEFRSRRIYQANDLVQGLGLGVIGTLPAIPARARQVLSEKSSRRDLHRQSLLMESVDAIRTLLLHTAQTDGLRVLMVTSAIGGEGKTSLASHLAASLARACRRTLLIDGDLRNPAAHRLFDLQAEPGLSEVLRGETEPDDVVRPTTISRLWMIPAGRPDIQAAQALAQKEVGDVLDRLKREYDFVIIDSSPVLPVADTLSLGQHVDGVILSVLLDVSRAPLVYTAAQRLRTLGIRILGTVAIGTGSEPGGVEFHYPLAASS
jgi:polysaccharide biosynthesis transport protein